MFHDKNQFSSCSFSPSQFNVFCQLNFHTFHLISPSSETDGSLGLTQDNSQESDEPDQLLRGQQHANLNVTVIQSPRS